jgi:hypothetical protein
MSTRSFIAIKRENSFQYVYCHHDGYPTYMMPRLTSLSEEQINQIMFLGDMSILDYSLECPAGHSFNTRHSGHSVFYGRDRKETGVSSQTAYSLAGLLNKAHVMGIEYVYIFDNIWTHYKVEES